jgi:hypothetical protein
LLDAKIDDNVRAWTLETWSRIAHSMRAGAVSGATVLRVINSQGIRRQLTQGWNKGRT